MEFVPVFTRYSIEIERDRFLVLLDSESYATGHAAFKDGNQTLCTKLGHETEAETVNYDGHFGAQIIFDLDVDNDTPENRAAIVKAINDHLDWCQTLEVVEHVRKSREENA